MSYFLDSFMVFSHIPSRKFISYLYKSHTVELKLGGDDLIKGAYRNANLEALQYLSEILPKHPRKFFSDFFKTYSSFRLASTIEMKENIIKKIQCIKVLQSMGVQITDKDILDIFVWAPWSDFKDIFYSGDNKFNIEFTQKFFFNHSSDFNYLEAEKFQFLLDHCPKLSVSTAVALMFKNPEELFPVYLKSLDKRSDEEKKKILLEMFNSYCLKLSQTFETRKSTQLEGLRAFYQVNTFVKMLKWFHDLGISEMDPNNLYFDALKILKKIDHPFIQRESSKLFEAQSGESQDGCLTM